MHLSCTSIKSRLLPNISLPSFRTSMAFQSINHLGHNLPDVWPSVSSTLPSLNPHANVDRESATIIDGRAIADMINSQIADEISRMKNSIGKCPVLVFVIVGKRSDSHAFVETKMKACDEVGIVSSLVELPAESTEDEVLRRVSDLNEDSSVHGVIVQLPLPDVTSRPTYLFGFKLWSKAKWVFKPGCASF